VLQTDISDLQANVTQVRTTVTSYGAGLKEINARLQPLEYFYHQKSKMILAAIGDKKVLIDDLIRLYDEQLVLMHERLRELHGKQHAAQEESNEAAHVQEARQNEYDKLIAYQQHVTDKLTEMEALRAAITQADDNTDVATMYFLLLEFQGRLRETNIIPQHQLSLDLRQKLGELETAKEHARAKSAALSAAQAEYTAYKTELNTKRADRHKKLLAEVEAIYPVPADDSPGGTAGPTTPASGQASSTPAAGTATPGSPTPSPGGAGKK
jgi:hypothetical protein